MNASSRLFSTIIKTVKPNGRLFEEAHPFFIYPKNTPNQPVHLKFFTQRFGRTAGTYVPLMTFFFGWPFAAKLLITKAGGL
ncbi:hypothetical protein BDD12DRAFT_898021 [Trichophaea hybrida]|nr:hypothetical protein BDD12DRAFT_898021 [Trichophaea hybrida]